MKRFALGTIWTLTAGSGWLALFGVSHFILQRYWPELLRSGLNAIPDLAMVGIFVGGFFFVMAVAAYLSFRGKLPGTRSVSRACGFPVIALTPPEQAG